MNPATLAKAARLPVVRALDGSYRVAGGDVYTVWQSAVEQRLLCDCRAGAAQSACSHRIAVRLHRERNNAVIRQGDSI